MKEYFVYELINLYGTVEYVGETTMPKLRFRNHTKHKPSAGNGKFYGRQDLVMNIVASFTDRKKALKLEGELKLHYNLKWDENDRSVKAGKKNVESGHIQSIGKKRKIPVIQFDKSGNLIKEWKSATDVKTYLGIDNSDICACINGRQKSAGGYVWKYKK